MIDVLLTHSFFLHFDPKQEKAMMPYPPLGTLFAAGYLLQRNYHVRLHDTMLARSEESLSDTIRIHQPAIVAIYEDDFNYLNKMCLGRMREAAFRMASIAKTFGCFVIIHGSDAADHYADYLRHGADIVVIGEGEQTLGDICETVLRKRSNDFTAIPGTAFRINDNIVQTEKRIPSKKLDEYPFPAWHLVDADTYEKVWRKRHGYFSLNMVTTRGCPYHCNWCAKPIYGQVYNSRTPGNVVDEMIILRDTLHPDHIWFADDIFGLKPGWVKEFSKLTAKNNISIPFKIQSRADLLLEDETIESLARAGCAEVWIGAESGAQNILDKMEKGTTISQIYQAREKLKRANIKTSFFLQFGYPGEGKAEINSTIRMVKDLMPDDIGISVSYPLPGTTFFEHVKKDLTVKHNWVDSDDLALLYRGTFKPAYYKRLHRYIHKIYRLKRGIILLADFLTFRTTLQRRDIKRILSIGYFAPAALIDKIKLYFLESA